MSHERKIRSLDAFHLRISADRGPSAGTEFFACVIGMMMPKDLTNQQFETLLMRARDRVVAHTVAAPVISENESTPAIGPQ